MSSNNKNCSVFTTTIRIGCCNSKKVGSFGRPGNDDYNSNIPTKSGGVTLREISVPEAYARLRAHPPGACFVTG
ncbi:uncharacterized protein METZ01_LOCUS478686, partial [marine metagenome]